MTSTDPLEQARNPLTPTLTLNLLAVHENGEVRFRVSQNPNTSHDTLELLLGDLNTQVRSQAQATLLKRARHAWTEVEAEQALDAAKAGDVVALEQLGLYRLERALANTTPSGVFARRTVPLDLSEPDRLREAVQYLCTAAMQGRLEARFYLGHLSRAQEFTNPPTRGVTLVDSQTTLETDLILPSRVEVRLGGDLIEGFDYVNPALAQRFLIQMGFAWTDPECIAEQIEAWAELLNETLEALHDWAEVENQWPEDELEEEEQTDDAEADEEELTFGLSRMPLDDSGFLFLEEVRSKAPPVQAEESPDRASVFEALHFNLETGWSVIEQLSEQAQHDDLAAQRCLALLHFYSGIGHARSSVVFRTLIQLKAQFEQGNS